jgi:hypothetical protein
MFILYFTDQDDFGFFWNEYARYETFNDAYNAKLAGHGRLIVEV